MRNLTAAETRGMKFCKSGVGIWTSVNNAYTIRKPRAADGTPLVLANSFLLSDGHGRFLGRFTSKTLAERAAREDLICKR